MDAADLKVFEAVSRLGSMNRAAAELHTVQSNVTVRIRSLEAELGQALFYRHHHGTTATPAGRNLIPYAMRIARLLEEARDAVANDGAPRGLLTVGSLETTAALRLSPILAGYAKAFPDVDVVLRTGTTCELIEDVLDYRLEGAFVCGPVSHPELEEEVMFCEELVIVTPPFVGGIHDIAGYRNLKIVVLRAGCSYRQRLEGVLSSRRITGLRSLEFGTIDCILGCVAAGFGVSLLPRAVVEDARTIDNIAIHSLGPSEARAETLFIRRRDSSASRACTALLEHTRGVDELQYAAE